jgi:hypothetical protein
MAPELLPLLRDLCAGPLRALSAGPLSVPLANIVLVVAVLYVGVLGYLHLSRYHITNVGLKGDESRKKEAARRMDAEWEDERRPRARPAEPAAVTAAPRANCRHDTARRIARREAAQQAMAAAYRRHRQESAEARAARLCVEMHARTTRALRDLLPD